MGGDMRKWLIPGLAMAVTLAAASACAPRPGAVFDLVRAHDGTRRVVQTQGGPVSGVASVQGQAFLGIPFAAPPVGALRFQPPQPAKPWTQTFDATRAPAACLQPSIPGMGKQSEDCLTLNVYAPHDAAGDAALPVMVWLYGGGFGVGSNVDYDPSRLAERQKVIVVALNYRLGAFGFLAHPGLKGTGLKGAGEGAYALLDQQAALHWVHDNIARFGGNPGNVTLFGESAGAWSVCYQLVAPGARGLFQHAILESGPCIAPDSVQTVAAAEAGGMKMAASLGCGDPATAVDCLRALPARTLQKAKSQRRGLLGPNSWAPVAGGDVLPVTPQAAFASGHMASVDVINGSNRNEGLLFLTLNRWMGKLWTRAGYEQIVREAYEDKAPQVLAAYADEARHSYTQAYADIVTDGTFACPAVRLNALLGKRMPVYAYEFDDPNAPFSLWRPPATLPLKSYHSSEIAYVFDTKWVLTDPARFTPSQQRLSDSLQAYWGAFARTGRPDAAGEAEWPRFDGMNVLRLSAAIVAPVATMKDAHRCAFWDALEG